MKNEIRRESMAYGTKQGPNHDMPCSWILKEFIRRISIHENSLERLSVPGEVLPYMSYTGMCRCEGYSLLSNRV